MRTLAVLLLTVSVALPATFRDDWLDEVAPILTTAERKLYQSLNAAERVQFAEAFWAHRNISEAEYGARILYVDETFGSGRRFSGTNTDRGRVYLSLGSPRKITRIASSRSFFPFEIWYYDEAPQIGMRSAVHFLFYQKNGMGEYKLYSPVLDTIRALMTPQAANRGMFPVNDMVNESDIRTRLNLSPAEDELIEAAIGVARGITGAGNEEVISLALTPSFALSRRDRTQVTSVLKAALPAAQSWTEEGLPVMDLDLPASGPLRISWNGILIDTAQAAGSLYRAYLLPGKYTVSLGEQAWLLEVSSRRPANDAGSVSDPMAWVSYGRQYLLRGNKSEAERCFARAQK